MEDLQIIGLYFDRNEAAIEETAKKYGAFCHSIAFNILSINADAEEWCERYILTGMECHSASVSK